MAGRMRCVSVLPSIGRFPPSSESSTGKPVRLASGWLNSRPGEYSPAAGSSLSRWLKTSCKISAIQKMGIEMPRIDPALMIWSAGRPGRLAETRPSGMPTTTAISSAVMTSSSEAGAAVVRVGQHRPVRVDGDAPVPR